MKETTIAALLAAAEALESEGGYGALAAELRFVAGERVEPGSPSLSDLVASALSKGRVPPEQVMANNALLTRLRATRAAQSSRSVDLPQVVSPSA
jgi:hypothetical protein